MTNRWMNMIHKYGIIIRFGSLFSLGYKQTNKSFRFFHINDFIFIGQNIILF